MEIFDFQAQHGWVFIESDLHLGTREDTAMDSNSTLPTCQTCQIDGDLCTINVSCSQPSESGEMSVQCSFEGDALLATFLLEKALRYVESHLDENP